MGKAPTISDWKALYQAALEFKEIEAWTWMYNSDVFGVQNPANGEIGYCCIVGALGEMFAMAHVPGHRGIGELHASCIRASRGSFRSDRNGPAAEVTDGLLRQQGRADKGRSPGD